MLRIIVYWTYTEKFCIILELTIEFNEKNNVVVLKKRRMGNFGKI